VEATRLVSESARVDDPVRVTFAGVVEGIEGVESSTLRVPHGYECPQNEAV
jgi:hypothetical protein